ncbi:Transmembrane protease serine 11G [Nymphon striatum]|nr:Transmembrane protease serine 11G [Nymphon striatum]
MSRFSNNQVSTHEYETSKVLQHVTVPIIKNEVCQRMLDEVDGGITIEPFHLCAGDPNGGFDACSGDSGSPLVVTDENSKWTLTAIVSHGIGCGRANHPGIYTRRLCSLEKRHVPYINENCMSTVINKWQNLSIISTQIA